MRINYFVGIEGTHGLIRKILETGTGVGPFKPFFGDAARQSLAADESLEVILQSLFGDYSAQEELNVGVTRLGAGGEMLDFLTNKSPTGTRVFFFKSTDNTETVDLYKSFLKISANRSRIERLTGMSEEALNSNPEGFTEATFEALAHLNEISENWTLDAWAPFDLNVLSGGAGNPSSKILFKAVTLPISD